MFAIAGAALAIFGVFGMWQAARLWRDPGRVSIMMLGNQGMVRGALPLSIGVVFIATGLLVADIAKPVPRHPTPGAVTAVILIAVGLVALACHFSIVWFDRPMWLIPPHLRNTGQTRSRRRG